MDRNCYLDNIEITQAKSLSARRAWIEISAVMRQNPGKHVALRKESVDRNIKRMPLIKFYLVALRKESVDRNDVLAVSAILELSRSPQGERG